MTQTTKSKEHYKTIIVGAGPAGTSCGYTLLKNGEDCLIIDRKTFPRDKLCGGGLTPQAHALIDRIFENIHYEYIPIKDINTYYNKKYICSFRIDKELRIVVRRSFDNRLLEEYQKKGGRFLTATIVNIEETASRINIKLLSGKEISCDYLIGADGANSIVRKHIQPAFPKGFLWLENNIVTENDQGLKVYFEDRYKNGYFYQFPNTEGYAIGYGEKHTQIEEYQRSLKEHDFSPTDRIKGAYIPMFDKLDYPSRDNIFLIGDAGGFTDSMTGEGLYFAAKSGENAALSIINGIPFRKQNSDVIKTIKLRQRMARAFYFKPLHRLFLSMCKRPSLLVRINKRVNQALSN